MNDVCNLQWGRPRTIKRINDHEIFFNYNVIDTFLESYFDTSMENCCFGHKKFSFTKVERCGMEERAVVSPNNDVGSGTATLDRPIKFSL